MQCYVIFTCKHLIICILYYCRSNSINFVNPLFSNVPPQHLYDPENENQEMEATNKIPQCHFTSSASNSGDYDTIKSDQVKFDKSSVYYNANTSDMNTAYYNKPKTLSKPKDAEKPVAESVVESDHHLPTSENLTDIQFVLENQYVLQDKTQSNENDPYIPLIVSQQKQPAVYKKLVSQQTPPST